MDPCARQSETAPALVSADPPQGAGFRSSKPLPRLTEGDPW